MLTTSATPKAIDTIVNSVERKCCLIFFDITENLFTNNPL